MRHATVILATLLVLGSFGLSASAFARGGYGTGGGAVGSRGNNVGGGFGDAPDGYDNRASDLRGEFHDYRGRDVWGHWGAYYGSMI